MRELRARRLLVRKPAQHLFGFLRLPGKVFAAAGALGRDRLPFVVEGHLQGGLARVLLHTDHTSAGGAADLEVMSWSKIDAVHCRSFTTCAPRTSRKIAVTCVVTGYWGVYSANEEAWPS